MKQIIVLETKMFGDLLRQEQGTLFVIPDHHSAEQHTGTVSETADGTKQSVR